MCGIVGYVGKKSAQDVLIDGLKRLEYRGYDSAGVAFPGGKKIAVIKSVGRVIELEKQLARYTELVSTSQRGPETSSGRQALNIGIAHTRWATHGKPVTKNAHPHEDCSGRIAVVHNGIVENYQILKEELQKLGHVFRSETDSEVIVHLIEEELKRDGAGFGLASSPQMRGENSAEFERAFFATLKKIKGTYGLVVMDAEQPETLWVARMGSPLVIGLGKDETIVASDASAIIAHTDKVVYLEDGEVARITAQDIAVKNLARQMKNKKPVTLDWSAEEAERGGYPHFMLKEIFEQPHSFADALRGRVSAEESTAKFGGLEGNIRKRLKDIDRIVIVACGTSYHAGLVGEYMFEEYAKVSTEVEYASEFRYRQPILGKKTVVIAISQSGETADTLAAVREAKKAGALTIGIVNVVGSTIARETDTGIYNHAGPEISVASTKAFTSQLGILSALALYLARERGVMNEAEGKRWTKELSRVPKFMKVCLEQTQEIKKIAKKYVRLKTFLYLGRKYQAPVALEGALKIKEIAYVGAQGYPAGEMKHGPIALIDSEALCVVIAPKDSVYEKTVSAIEEVKARGAHVLTVTTQGNTTLAKKADHVLYIPKTLEPFTSILSVVLLQLLAYHASVALGYDVDKPRNLAKSVTVE